MTTQIPFQPTQSQSRDEQYTYPQQYMLQPNHPHPPPNSHEFHELDDNNSELHQLLRKQVEYYFSDQNLRRDNYLQTILANYNGRVPTSVIANFRKVRNLYHMYGAKEDCCMLLTKAMLQSSIVHVDGPFLCPFGYSTPISPKNTTSKHSRDSNHSSSRISAVNGISSTASVSSSSTHGETEWTNNNNVKDTCASNPTISTCSPTSFASETAAAVPSSTLDQDDSNSIYSSNNNHYNSERDTTKMMRDLSLNPSGTGNESFHQLEHQQLPPQQYHAIHKQLPQMQPPIEMVYYDQTQAGSNVYPGMAEFVPDQYSSQYYYNQVAMPGLAALTTAESQTQTQLPKGIVVNPYYGYNYYYYQYPYQLPPQQQQQHLQHATQGMIPATDYNQLNNVESSNDPTTMMPPTNVVYVPPLPSPAAIVGPPTSSPHRHHGMDTSQVQVILPSSMSRNNRKLPKRRNKDSRQTNYRNKDENHRRHTTASTSDDYSTTKNSSNASFMANPSIDKQLASKEVSTREKTSTKKNNQKKKKNKNRDANYNSNSNDNNKNRQPQVEHPENKDKILSEENFPALISTPTTKKKIGTDNNCMTPTSSVVNSLTKKKGYAEALLKKQTPSKVDNATPNVVDHQGKDEGTQCDVETERH